MRLFTLRLPSTNSPASQHYCHLQEKYSPPVKILPLIVLIALGFEAVTAVYFVIGVSCVVTRFSIAYTTNDSMSCRKAGSRSFLNIGNSQTKRIHIHGV